MFPFHIWTACSNQINFEIDYWTCVLLCLYSGFQKPSPTRVRLFASASFLGGANLCKSPKYSSLVNKHEIKPWNRGSREGSWSTRFWAAPVWITLELLLASISGKKGSFVSFTPARFLNPRLVGLIGLSIGGSFTMLNPDFAWDFLRISAVLASSSHDLWLDSSFRLAFLCISIIFLCLSLWAFDSLLYSWIMSLPVCPWSIHRSRASRSFSKFSFPLHIVKLSHCVDHYA